MKKKSSTAGKSPRSKPITLEPNVRFPATTIQARCKRALTTIFTRLYEMKMTAEHIARFQWQVDGDTAVVRLIPFSQSEDASAVENATPIVQFAVDNYLPERRKKKGPKHTASRRKLARQLLNWVADEIHDAFESEKVDIEYSYFNEEDWPFEIAIELICDKQIGKSTTLWSNTRKIKPRRTKKPKLKLPSKGPDYSKGGWQRFYFDDGKTRRFWYIHRTGATYTTVQGNLGTRGTTKAQKRTSPADAKEAVKKSIATKTKAGYIAYAPQDFPEYEHKHRLVKLAVRKAMANFEKKRGFRLPEQHRRHLLTTNGGRFFEQIKHLSLPAHPVKQKADLYGVSGFAISEDDIATECSRMVLPPGHVVIANGGFSLFTIDPTGTVFIIDDYHRADLDDDRLVRLEDYPCQPVAHCFDEFLTRVAKFPNDTNASTKAKPDKNKQQKHDENVRQIAKARKAAASRPLRRFFFDDGKERKFWNIQTNGKQFATFYGRIGGKELSSTKRFSSSQQANAAAAKIIGQKTRKGYNEVLSEPLVFERPSGLRRATVTAIKKLETKIGTKLPDDYRRFLETQNGGEPLIEFIAIPGLNIASVEVGYFFGLSPKCEPCQCLMSAIDEAGQVIPKGHLPICCGQDWYTLSLKKKPGCVYFWSHESDDVIFDLSEAANDRFRASAGYLLANSFDEFLTRIAMYQPSD